MQDSFKSVDDYINQLPTDRQEPIRKLRKIILENLPPGFKEEISYGMIGYVILHNIYPAGYHTDPSLLLPFINLASQKNYISLYHYRIYAIPELLVWFENEYPKHVNTKLNMGKSCIRFKNIKTIPYSLIGDLCQKISVEDFIQKYEER